MTHNFCTYFDSNYLYRGVAMYRSLLKTSADFKLWVLCFDEVTYRLLSKMSLERVELITLEDFEDPELLKAKQGRSPVEYFWTCTPSLPLYVLMKKPELEMITYIDADLYFYSDPSPIFEEFGSRSILLTEHRYARDFEKKVMTNGLYNVQFLTFRNDAEGLKAAKWWRERCLEWCYRRSEDGKFGDQKYLDDWAERFRNVCVLQHKGAGLAPWNIVRYDIREKNGEVFVDSERLIFYHFHYFKIYSNRLFNLSTYELSRRHRELVYYPYIKSLGETMHEIRRYDKAFSRGYTPLRFVNIKEALWTLMGLFRGNVLFSRTLIGEN